MAMKQAVLLLFALASAVTGGGCASVKAARPVPESALEYREIRGDIQKQGEELALTGNRIENKTANIVEGLSALETAITDAVPENTGAERQDWISQVKTLRVRAGELHAEAENLNRQLRTERETMRALERKFNEAETGLYSTLSERDAEIAVLKADSQKATGQRNTYLAILITAGAAAGLAIALKVLRVLKTIPI
jgi:chromosome segregation ATPase